MGFMSARRGATHLAVPQRITRDERNTQRSPANSALFIAGRRGRGGSFRARFLVVERANE